MSKSSFLSDSMYAHTNNSVLISENEITTAASAVCGRMEHMNCPWFNENIPSEEFLSNYIKRRPNISLVTTDLGLSHDTFGVVLKREFEQENSLPVCLFLIAISPQLKNNFERIFTIAHELGHIILHGRLLESNMMIPRRSNVWHQPTNRYQPLMEVEANIFSLKCLLPVTLLDIVYRYLPMSQRELFVFYLHCVLEKVFECKIDICMVVARIYLYNQVNHDKSLLSIPSRVKLDKLCERGHSWIVHGLSSKNVYCREIDKSIYNNIDNNIISHLLIEIQRQDLKL